MRNIACLIWMINSGLMGCYSLLPKNNLLKRYVEHSPDVDNNIGCVHMESFPGTYWYTSAGDEDVCGLYLIGLADQLVQLEFEHFNIDCATGGLLAIVDGWELQGQFFPSNYDHSGHVEERYQQFCGKDIPPIFISSQNVALIQYRIPQAGQGFKIKVTLPPNPRPCNVVSMIEEGTFTLRNYGLKSNCSFSIVYPEKIDIIAIDIGESSRMPKQIKETGLITKCNKRNRGDYLELLHGGGLDPLSMWRKAALCGIESFVDKSYKLGCQHSVVRLVSSGNYYNSITFIFSMLDEQDSLGADTC